MMNVWGIDIIVDSSGYIHYRASNMVLVGSLSGKLVFAAEAPG